MSEPDGLLDVSLIAGYSFEGRRVPTGCRVADASICHICEGLGYVEAFENPCEECDAEGVIVSVIPLDGYRWCPDCNGRRRADEISYGCQRCDTTGLVTTHGDLVPWAIEACS